MCGLEFIFAAESIETSKFIQNERSDKGISKCMNAKPSTQLKQKTHTHSLEDSFRYQQKYNIAHKTMSDLTHELLLSDVGCGPTLDVN